MSRKICILSESMVHKIAAGEVIERPASVIKELVENAIDAQCRRISIQIKDGGKQLISVSDDGSGILREDIELCARRHATSKLINPSELFSIQTLGFRGEALASIGAVSHMTIQTQTEGESEGTQIIIEGGIRRKVSSMGRASGTTVIVRNLFFNTPARRKFLRQVNTEIRYITQTVIQLAAAHPEIGFELVHDERNILHYVPAVEPRERAAEILGIESEKLLQAQNDESGIEINAFVSPPSLCRKSRDKQFLIIRGRPIVSRVLSQAIYLGYGGLLASDTHPSFIVWLDLEPNTIDVNVHPTKKQIRFADEKGVEQVLQMSIRQALRIPQTPLLDYRQSAHFNLSEAKEARILFSHDEKKAAEQQEDEAIESSLTSQLPLSILIPSTLRSEPISQSDSIEKLVNIERVWQIHRKYIMTLYAEGLALIDQQAAHERILFEETLETIGGSTADSQQLLLPITLCFNAAEWEAVSQAKELFAELGFSWREFGPQTLLIEALPVTVKKWNEGELFYDILHEFMEEQKRPGKGIKESLAISFASKNSIKAGDPLSLDQIKSLLKKLCKTEEPFVCPHGRPVIVKILSKEIDRLFRR